MFVRDDAIWLAGLLEGEGSFGNYGGTPTIQLQMTDRDVVDRARRIMKVGDRVPWQRKGEHKPVFTCVANGTTAVSWMMILFQFMGERRQAKIAEVLAAWRASPRKPRAPRGQRFMATCHPDRVIEANGLCGTCYMREWRARKATT